MNIVFYDIETSGLDSNIQDIIQIAAIAFSIEGGEWNELEEFEVKLRFDQNKASKEALDGNCYNEEIWEKEAIPRSSGLRMFSSFLNKYKDVKRVGKKSGKEFLCCRTAGHNIKMFDDHFVRAMFNKFDLFCPMDYLEVYDTLQLVLWDSIGYQNKPENYQLGTLCDVFDITLETAHDALSDIRANSMLAQKIITGG